MNNNHLNTNESVKDQEIKILKDNLSEVTKQVLFIKHAMTKKKMFTVDEEINHGNQM